MTLAASTEARPLVSVSIATTLSLPAHGLSLQLVGRLFSVDAESDTAKLISSDDEIKEDARLEDIVHLTLNTALLPTEDVQAVPPQGLVHVFGRLCPIPGEGPLGARVMRVDILRRVDGADMGLWAATVARRDAFIQKMINAAAAAPKSLTR